MDISLHDAPIAASLALAVLMGLGALAAPSLVTRQFGIPELTADGRGEVRAVYGGFGLAMAMALAMALVEPSLRAGICLTASLALLGMAGGRAASALIDRRISAVATGYFGLEALLAAGLWWAM